MLDPVDYDRRLHQVYARGRGLPDEAKAVWINAFSRHASPRRPLTVLDLGCGTGRFTPALAEEFGGPVYGVEPASRMRAVAVESAGHERVTYLAGEAAGIPLLEASCDLVLMYLVLHHVQDKPAAAAEVARVLRDSGRLLIQSVFCDRMPDLLWHRYFPAAPAIEARMFPTLDEVVGIFDLAGLRYVTVERVSYWYASSLAEYADRLRLRAISTFEYLSEEDVERGFAALDAAVAAETDPQPVGADMDLLVLSRDPRAEPA